MARNGPTSQTTNSRKFKRSRSRERAQSSPPIDAVPSNKRQRKTLVAAHAGSKRSHVEPGGPKGDTENDTEYDAQTKPRHYLYEPPAWLKRDRCNTNFPSWSLIPFQCLPCPNSAIPSSSFASTMPLSTLSIALMKAIPPFESGSDHRSSLFANVET
jgi:hypothetical protein